MGDITRRGLLRHLRSAVGGAVLAGVGSAVLAGCSTSAGSRLAPASAAQPVVVTFFPWQGWPNFEGPNWAKFAATGLQQFESGNPGIRVRLGETKPGPAPKYTAAILAGDGPDVFSDWAMAPYLEAGLVLNLAPYLQQDNVNLDIWSPGQMRAMRTGGGVWFVPDYVHVDAMVINLSLLDTLGIPYPQPDWTHSQAQRLFEAASGVSGGQRRFGVHLDFPGSNLGTGDGDADSYVLHRFGGALMDASREKCLVGQSGAVEALRWHMQLYWDGVAGGAYNLETTPFMETGSNLLLQNLTTWSNKFKWTYFPVPVFPAGQFSFEATDFLAINAGTKHPEPAWTLLRWLAAEPEWSRYCMKILLRTPSLTSLWTEYAQVVESVAPPAKGKNIHWFTEAVAHWGIADRMFKYAHAQAINAINSELALAFSRKQGVSESMRAAAAQVNALESTSTTFQGAQRAAARAFRSTGPAVAVVQPGL